MKKVILRFAGLVDVQDLYLVEERAWSLQGEVIQAEPAKIRRRVETEQIVTIARVDGNPAGSQFAFQLDWNGDLDRLTTWDELTRKGWTDQVHRRGGQTGFLVGVGVVPDFRRVLLPNNLVDEPRRISELLLIKTFRGLRSRGIEQVIACARIPAYHQWPGMSVEEYCQHRRDDGKLHDPVLRFHEGLTAEIVKPVAYAMDDAESRNGGCWVKYNLNKVFNTPPWTQIKT